MVTADCAEVAGASPWRMRERRQPNGRRFGNLGYRLAAGERQGRAPRRRNLTAGAQGVNESALFDNLRAVLFDMDGLIVDTEPIHFAAFREYMRRHGVELPESVMGEFIGYTEQDNMRDLKGRYGIADPVEAMVAERGAIYLELVSTLPLEVLPGFWEFSAAAGERGLKQGVASSAPGVQVGIVLRRLFELRPDLGSPGEYFDAVVTGDDIRRNKPAPDVYLEGARRLDVPAASCLALEDSPPGVRSAAEAGMVVVAVPNKYTKGLAFPGAQAVVGSLEEAGRLVANGTPRVG